VIAADVDHALIRKMILDPCHPVELRADVARQNDHIGVGFREQIVAKLKVQVAGQLNAHF
jgi:hypothetical protein